MTFLQGLLKPKIACLKLNEVNVREKVKRKQARGFVKARKPHVIGRRRRALYPTCNLPRRHFLDFQYLGPDSSASISQKDVSKVIRTTTEANFWHFERGSITKKSNLPKKNSCKKSKYIQHEDKTYKTYTLIKLNEKN